MSTGKKLLVVVAIQLALLFCIIGFKEYTILTGDTVLLKTAPVDPQDLIRGTYTDLSYGISRLDPATVSGDVYARGTVYVELQRSTDGYWSAIAIHQGREHTSGGTVLIKGNASDCFGRTASICVRYGIEQVFIPEGSASQLPRGSGHTVAVEVKVDRFGNAVPRRFVVDGQPFNLQRN